MNAHRVNIIALLQLIASEDEQEKYQKEVPFVSVPNEMCCQWFDDFYHPDFNEFAAEFTDEELRSFSEFNKLYKKHVDSLPETLGELKNHSGWVEVSALANKILQSHNWQNLKLEYDSE
ncbi:hypothetical protein WKI13_13240 [Teredinibacter turnerae]|uniref:hypothetical protein n=1 Tax=Teredinibacter turnerae TaxID=2426 RepID=UPI00036A7B10|nr:hypothetical protein [Teredinibacter turnerae]